MDPTEALLQRGYRYALALTHDRAQAEDLLHDAWVNVLARRPVDSIPYLLRAIRNRWIDQVRKRAVVPMVSLDREPAAEARAGVDQTHAVDDEVGRALATLSVDERETLYLHAVEGWTAAEIATLTDRPRNTILTILARARQRLAQWRAALEVL